MYSLIRTNHQQSNPGFGGQAYKQDHLEFADAFRLILWLCSKSPKLCRDVDGWHSIVLIFEADRANLPGPDIARLDRSIVSCASNGLVKYDNLWQSLDRSMGRNWGVERRGRGVSLCCEVTSPHPAPHFIVRLQVCWQLQGRGTQKPWRATLGQIDGRNWRWGGGEGCEGFGNGSMGEQLLGEVGEMGWQHVRGGWGGIRGNAWMQASKDTNIENNEGAEGGLATGNTSTN